ncbi:MAG: hypothetical protein ACR2RE_09745 [Geminicoccaceae bacterium]
MGIARVQIKPTAISAKLNERFQQNLAVIGLAFILAVGTESSEKLQLPFFDRNADHSQGVITREGHQISLLDHELKKRTSDCAFLISTEIVKPIQN